MKGRGEMNMSEGNYIVRGLSNGPDFDEWFYTGRSGDGWLSLKRDDAFGYESLQVARNKALLFNRMTTIHGYRFIAIPRHAYSEYEVSE